MTKRLDGLLPTVGLANAHRHWKDREIYSITLSNGIELSTQYYENKSITAYSEPGEVAHIIWFEVDHQSYISRYNGIYVTEVQFK